MDPAVIVSPHLDDAVLSCGQLLAGRPDMVVVTVMAGYPPSTVAATTYDRQCQFLDPVEALDVRRREDAEALDLLAARPVYLPFLDGQYRPPLDQAAFELLAGQIASSLAMAVVNADAHAVFGPLGLVHPDHELVATAFLQVVEALGIEAWLYEELPARVLWPEQVPVRLEAAGRSGQLVLGFPGTGPKAVKQEAARCYRSQLWALDEPCYLVPERYWRVWL